MRITDDQAMLLDTTRRFLAGEMPMSKVRELGGTPDGFEQVWWEQAAALGWTSIIGADDVDLMVAEPLVDLALLSEELGRAVAPGPFLPCNLVLAGIAPHRGDLVDSLVERLRDGRTVATWCFKERDAGWRPAGVCCTATPTAEGYALSGTKTLVEGAAQSAWFLVTARAPEGLTQFLVPADAPGVSVRSLDGIDFVRRYGDVELSAVEVPASHVVGVPGGADDDVQRMLDVAAVLQCAEMVGAASQVFDFTVAYASDRYSFGRPLTSYQALKHKFADMKLWVEASRATTYAAARAVDAGADDASKLASAAKTYVGDQTPEVVQGCIQMHGAIGVTWEHDLHVYLRRILVDRGLFGAPDHHRELVGLSLDC